MASSGSSNIQVNIRARIALLFLVAALPGCAPSTNAVFQSLQYAVQSDSTIAGVRLNPNLRYLRVTIEGRTVLLALGFVEQDSRGPIEVWYSAQREVLRLQNGRMVGAIGLTTEWRNVVVPELLPWPALARVEGQTHWMRVRDVMPGYRFGVRDTLALQVAAPPPKSALRDIDPQSLTWFEERTEPQASGGRPAPERSLPVARYAVSFRNSAGTAIYGEQCLKADLCFTWQHWPAMPQGAK